MKAIDNEMDAIMAFLETNTYAEKYDMLGIIHEFLTDHMINTLAASMDVVIPEGDLETRFEELRNCISTFKRFEINRR